MPLYDFVCEDCVGQFEITCSMSEIENLKPLCPRCNGDNVYRDFSSNIFVFNGPTTLGSMADKNTSSMSNDYKNYLTEKHNKYKKKEYSGPKPKMKE